MAMVDEVKEQLNVSSDYAGVLLRKYLYVGCTCFAFVVGGSFLACLFVCVCVCVRVRVRVRVHAADLYRREYYGGATEGVVAVLQQGVTDIRVCFGKTALKFRDVFHETEGGMEICPAIPGKNFFRRDGSTL